MRLSLDDNEARESGGGCFRVVALTTEIQNDAEVVKPVLDELEVVRLSAALGLMPSVSPRDFEHAQLPPEEFDDEFAHYLHRALYREDRAADADAVATLRLFGKQQEVKRALTRFGLWSAELDKGLKAHDQGIYCVTRTSENAPTIVLFAWIQDPFFDPSRLRETATYVLRFLACMSADLQCYLSPQDVAEVEEAVRSVSTDSHMWSPSFSVGFRVEKQEDKQDGVSCDHVGTIGLPNVDNARSMQLLKGSFPAVMTVLASPERKISKRETKPFNNIRSFAEWVVQQAKRYALSFDFSGIADLAFRDELLRAGGCYPNAQLEAIDAYLARSLAGVEEQSREEALMETEERRDQLFKIASKLFDIDTLLGTPGHAGTEHDTLKKLVKSMEARSLVWAALDDKTKVLLRVPIRLKNQIKQIFAVFHEQWQSPAGPDWLDQILDAIPFEKKKVVRTSSGKSMLNRVLDLIVGSSSSTTFDVNEAEVASAFRERMKDPLIAISRLWWDEGIEVMLAKTTLQLSSTSFGFTTKCWDAKRKTTAHMLSKRRLRSS